MSTSTNFMESKIALNFEDPSIVHDRILIVGEKKFYVISETLSLWSEHFRILFGGNFKESNQKKIELLDLDIDIFEIFQRSIYQHISPVLKVEDIIPLIEMSYRFLAPVVFQQCMDYIDKNFDKLDDIKLQLLETSCVHGNEGLKNKVALSMKDHLTCENCSEYLDCCEKFDLADVKARISEVVNTWLLSTIPRNILIELTKSAFKHDLLSLKIKLRNCIFTLAQKYDDRKWGILNENKKIQTYTPTVNWFLVNNQEEIFALPPEIRKFTIMSTCKNDM